MERHPAGIEAAHALDPSAPVALCGSSVELLPPALRAPASGIRFVDRRQANALVFVSPREGPLFCGWTIVRELESRRPVLKRVERGGGLVWEILGPETGKTYTPPTPENRYTAIAAARRASGAMREPGGTKKRLAAIGRAAPLWLGLAVIVAFYAFVVGAGHADAWFSWSRLYDGQAEGFRAGHLYLPERPSAALRALPDPYNPANMRFLALGPHLLQGPLLPLLGARSRGAAGGVQEPVPDPADGRRRGADLLVLRGPPRSPAPCCSARSRRPPARPAALGARARDRGVRACEPDAVHAGARRRLRGGDHERRLLHAGRPLPRLAWHVRRPDGGRAVAGRRQLQPGDWRGARDRTCSRPSCCSPRGPRSRAGAPIASRAPAQALDAASPASRCDRGPAAAVVLAAPPRQSPALRRMARVRGPLSARKRPAHVRGALLAGEPAPLSRHPVQEHVRLPVPVGAVERAADDVPRLGALARRPPHERADDRAPHRHRRSCSWPSSRA